MSIRLLKIRECVQGEVYFRVLWR